MQTVRISRGSMFICSNGRMEVIKIKKIGLGAFKKVYQSIEDPTRVFLVDSKLPNRKDHQCEALALYAKGKHLPVMSHIGSLENPYRNWETDIDIDYDNCDVWETKYYLPFKKANCKRADYNSMVSMLRVFQDCGNDRSYFSDFLKDCKKRGVLKSILDAFQEFFDAISNYGEHFSFEICKRNVRVDHKGNLILTDPFFSWYWK